MGQITNFIGGVNTAIKSTLINPSESVLLLNATITDGTLHSALDSTNTLKRVKRYFTSLNTKAELNIVKYTSENQLLTSSEIYRDYAYADGRVCYSDGSSICKITNGTPNEAKNDFEWSTLGATQPVGKLIARVRGLNEGEDFVIEQGDYTTHNIGAYNISYKVLKTDGAVLTTELTNTSNAKVTISGLGSEDKVYRELLTEDGYGSGLYTKVLDGDGVDGETNIYNPLTFVKSYGELYAEPIVNLRASNFDGAMATVSGCFTYKSNLKSSDTYTTKLTIDKLHLATFNSTGVTQIPLDIEITTPNLEPKYFGSTMLDSPNIAFGTKPECWVSTFTYDGMLFLMAGLRYNNKVEKFEIYQIAKTYPSSPTEYNVLRIINSNKIFSTTIFSTSPTAYLYSNGGMIFPDPTKKIEYILLDKLSETNSFSWVTQSTPTAIGVDEEDSLDCIMIENPNSTGFSNKYIALMHNADGSAFYGTTSSFIHEWVRISDKFNRVRPLGGFSGANNLWLQDDKIVIPCHSCVVTFDTILLTTTIIPTPTISTINYSHISAKLDLEHPNKLIHKGTRQKCFVFTNDKHIIYSHTNKFTNSRVKFKVDLHTTIEKPTDDSPEIIHTAEYLGGGKLTGEYSYAVAQMSEDGSTIGAISYVTSEVVTVTQGQIRIDTRDVFHTQPLRLFRASNNLSVYTLVEDIDLPEIYIDDIPDDDIALNPTAEWDYVDAPPENSVNLTSYQARLFASVDNVLYWSEVGDPNKWDRIKSFVRLDSTILALASLRHGLIIFMRNTIKILSGDDIGNFRLTSVTDKITSIYKHSIQVTEGGVFFFTDKGLSFTDGRQLKDISYGKLEGRDYRVISSASTSRIYYALIKFYGESELNQERVILMYDYQVTPTFSLFNGDNVDSLGIVNSELHHSYNGWLYKTFDVGMRLMEWVSHSITEGALSMVKEWAKIRVVHSVIGTLKVLIDNKVVTTFELDSTSELEESTSDNCFDLVDLSSTKDVKLDVFHLPKDRNKGRELQFHFKGVGTLYSIEYTLSGRRTVK